MSRNPLSLLRRTTTSPQQTQDLAARLAALASVGDLFVLTGDLGAGKTCFTQGFARGLGIVERVTSPTFTLHNVYEAPGTAAERLHHLDVYRLEQLSETLDLDLPELIESGVTVIEWGEQILPVLGTSYLEVELVLGDDDDERHISIEVDRDAAPAWRDRLAALEATIANEAQR